MATATRRNTEIRAKAPIAPAEDILWEALEAPRFRRGLEFSRDRIVGDHIVHMSSYRAKIAVEFDLPVGNERSNEDKARLAALQARGYDVVSVTSKSVYEDVQQVLERLLDVASAKNALRVCRTVRATRAG